ncbi:MAG TPA: hypothetical protein PLS69_11405, partial [Terricaulis sp.]|nr:hypothetical protein [Terricaulis sp.]
MQRQALAFALVAVVVSAAGVGFELSGGVSLENALQLWLWIGVVAALLVAVVREFGRNTITSVARLGK